jgi:propanol-preferring alcohol dehydrogenase
MWAMQLKHPKEALRAVDLPDLGHPVVPGHEIVGRVVATGLSDSRLRPGTRVGVPWLGWTCGICSYCWSDREHSCEHARFAGYQIAGGYADQAVADQRFCFDVPESYSDQDAAPLLCAGLIGYRSLRMAGDARHLGIYGFGAAAYILTQVARHQGPRGLRVYARWRHDGTGFGATDGRSMGRRLRRGAPQPLDAAIIFAPVGPLVPAALRAIAPGGTVVCGGIHTPAIRRAALLTRKAARLPTSVMSTS